MRLIPSAKKALIGDAFSASVYTVITAFSAASVLLILSAKSLKLIDRSYFKLAIPAGLCVGVAIGAVLGVLACVASGFGELEKEPKETVPCDEKAKNDK